MHISSDEANPNRVGSARDDESNMQCTSKFTAPLNVFASFLHMHGIGKQIWTTQYRNDEFVRTVNRAEFYSYDFQQQTKLNLTILPGDLLSVHCIFDSSSKTEPTRFGLASSDEMCMDFLSYYPKMRINNQDFAYCGYYRAGLTFTACGSGEGFNTGESIINMRNPSFSDIEQGLERTFGQPPSGDCPIEDEDD